MDRYLLPNRFAVRHPGLVPRQPVIWAHGNVAFQRRAKYGNDTGVSFTWTFA